MQREWQICPELLMLEKRKGDSIPLFNIFNIFAQSHHDLVNIQLGKRGTCGNTAWLCYL